MATVLKIEDKTMEQSRHLKALGQNLLHMTMLLWCDRKIQNMQRQIQNTKYAKGKYKIPNMQKGKYLDRFVRPLSGRSPPAAAPNEKKCRLVERKWKWVVL